MHADRKHQRVSFLGLAAILTSDKLSPHLLIALILLAELPLQFLRREVGIVNELFCGFLLIVAEIVLDPLAFEIETLKYIGIYLDDMDDAMVKFTQYGRKQRLTGGVY